MGFYETFYKYGGRRRKGMSMKVMAVGTALIVAGFCISIAYRIYKPAQHMTLMEIPIDGPVADFQAQLISKGFLPSNTLFIAGSGENTSALKGKFLSYPATIVPRTEAESGFIWGCDIIFEEGFGYDAPQFLIEELRNKGEVVSVDDVLNIAFVGKSRYGAIGWDRIGMEILADDIKPGFMTIHIADTKNFRRFSIK